MTEEQWRMLRDEVVAVCQKHHIDPVHLVFKQTNAAKKDPLFGPTSALMWAEGAEMLLYDATDIHLTRIIVKAEEAEEEQLREAWTALE